MLFFIVFIKILDYLCIRMLKRKQALLGSNLSAIGIQRYAVICYTGREKFFFLPYLLLIPCMAKKTQIILS